MHFHYVYSEIYFYFSQTLKAGLICFKIFLCGNLTDKNQDGEEDGAVVAYKDGARIEDQGENKNADQEKTENEDQYEAKTKDQERVKIETQDKDKKTKKNLNLIGKMV